MFESPNVTNLSIYSFSNLWCSGSSSIVSRIANRINYLAICLDNCLLVRTKTSSCFVPLGDMVLLGEATQRHTN